MKALYAEMNALSSGTNGKPSSSYRMAICVEHATYNCIISTLWNNFRHSF